MDMDARAIPRRVFEWIFRPAALREARAGLRAPDDPREAAARQAKLVLEVARRTAEPAEALPPGGQPAVLLALYRDAIYWALAARRAGPQPDRPPTCARCGTRRTRSSSRGSPPDNDDSAALRRTLFDDYAPRALDGQRRGRRARAHLRRGAGLGPGRPAPRGSSASLVQRWLRVGAGGGGRAGAG